MKKFLALTVLLGLSFVSFGCTDTNLEGSVISDTDLSVNTDTETKTETEAEKPVVKSDNEELQAEAQDFINNYLMNGTAAPIKSFEDTGCLYEMTVDVNGQTITSYIDKDGENFFPQVMNIEETIAQKEAALEAERKAKEAELKDLTKLKVPTVELFVMSHCPYGTQMEKGIIPVVKTLGDTIDFEIKFNSYAMHDKKELQEQMNQHCIAQEEPEKFLPYLECFLEAGDGKGCLKTAEINIDDMEACVEDTDEEYSIMANYEDKSTWQGQFPTFNISKEDNEKYGVKGSPTLVVNGKTMKTGRDSASLLQTICAGFEEAPKECDTELSPASPTPGFGYGKTTTGSTDAGCGA